MNYSPPGSAELDAIKATDGSVVESVEGIGCTLLANTTYFFPFGDPDAPTPTETPLVDVQLKWDNAIALVATVETCSFPKFKRSVKAGAPSVR